MRPIKIALCQMNVVNNKNQNINKAISMVKEASSNNADIVVLPEMFNCPYNNEKFIEYAEEAETGGTVKAVSRTAKDAGVYVVAGSIPELKDGKIYNSCYVINREGGIIGVHRKIHLFDINIPGGITFKESDMLSAGNKVTVVDTEFCKMGIAICYDMRFPELFRLMALQRAKLIIVPAAFNMITGPAHWELTIRMRALDNQVFTAAVSPARDIEASYVAYGHSAIANPWGTIVGMAGEGEEILYADMDLAQVDKIRRELPLLQHRRTDVYESSAPTKKNRLTN